MFKPQSIPHVSKDCYQYIYDEGDGQPGSEIDLFIDHINKVIEATINYDVTILNNPLDPYHECMRTQDWIKDNLPELKTYTIKFI